MTTHLYFAFGSNLSIEQMHRRCPSSVARAPAVVRGYRIGFAGYSHGWRGGVATMHDDATRSMPGLLYSLEQKCLDALDRLEGHPHCYRRTRVIVEVSPQERALAWTYRKADDDVRPSDRYLRIISEGYTMLGAIVTDGHRASLASAAASGRKARRVPRSTDRSLVPTLAMDAWAFREPDWGEEQREPGPVYTVPHATPTVHLYDDRGFDIWRFVDRVCDALADDGDDDGANCFMRDALLLDGDDVRQVLEVAQQYVDVPDADALLFG